MQREFWLDRWSSEQIGFHQPAVNPWLQRYWPSFELPSDCGVFVPLCGKSLDMGWLQEQGHSVIGVEIAETAVRAFYREAGTPVQVERLRHMLRFDGGGITIFCGDFMDLQAVHLREAVAVYDRAALIALPPKMREHYADHLLRIIREGCQILLITLEYPQGHVSGPPHSVDEPEVQALFGGRCSIERLRCAPTRELPPKFAEAGLDEVTEAVYRLVKHH